MDGRAAAQRCPDLLPVQGDDQPLLTVAAGEGQLEDVAWVYDEAHAEVRGIEGLIAFYNEKVDLEVDGQPWERPQTPFS